MRTFIIAALSLCLSTSALAFDAGITLEMGRQVLPKGSLAPLFSSNKAATPTITLSSDITDFVTVQLGWQYSAFASTLYMGDDETQARFFLSEHRLLPGVRFDTEHERFTPYVELNALVGISTLWADDDPSRRTNPGQVKERSLLYGAQPVAGVEFAIPFGPPRESRAVAVHVEGGWSFEADPTFGTIGQLQHGAGVVRGGVTLRL